jgi:hypothetical protein
MRIDRLQHLITVLQNVPLERFDISNWRVGGACGTVCCAAGWAALDPQFNEQGLVMPGTRPLLILEDETLDGFDALQVFFELTSEQVLYVFCAYSYAPPHEQHNVKPADVIARIRALIRIHQVNENTQHLAPLVRALDDDARTQVEDIEQAYIAAGEPEDEE